MGFMSWGFVCTVIIAAKAFSKFSVYQELLYHGSGHGPAKPGGGSGGGIQKSAAGRKVRLPFQPPWALHHRGKTRREGQITPNEIDSLRGYESATQQAITTTTSLSQPRTTTPPNTLPRSKKKKRKGGGARGMKGGQPSTQEKHSITTTIGQA
ncbi:hypothetical protein K504DRAFT_462893 [Pleomassaria siparia CBS 279.74]|uniref:Uncharacterized protein n=1 Tax=Pleomassaria siparia CBS 279.74 TaxID=1314801 RepID=A0A6G1JV03_9PLEO|nr:hypothetical protein K504DRAFT_462893 [Pleomassaria siparia CBS 279.74]